MAKKKMNEWSLTLLRVVLGIIFLYHGYTKLFVPGGFTLTIDLFRTISIPLPVYSALFVSALEFFGGLFLIFGLLTKWSSVLLLIEMIVGFFKVHYANGFSITDGGYEFALLLIAGLVIIIANGAGKVAIGKITKNKQLQ